MNSGGRRDGERFDAERACGALERRGVGENMGLNWRLRGKAVTSREKVE